jgi:hypothetical protein
MFFDHKQYLSMERLIGSGSTETELWELFALRNPEDGDHT